MTELCIDEEEANLLTEESDEPGAQSLEEALSAAGKDQNSEEDTIGFQGKVAFF